MAAGACLVRLTAERQQAEVGGEWRSGCVCGPEGRTRRLDRVAGVCLLQSRPLSGRHARLDAERRVRDWLCWLLRGGRLSPG